MNKLKIIENKYKKTLMDKKVIYDNFIISKFYILFVVYLCNSKSSIFIYSTNI